MELYILLSKWFYTRVDIIVCTAVLAKHFLLQLFSPKVNYYENPLNTFTVVLPIWNSNICFTIIGKLLQILFLIISTDTMFKQSAGDNLPKWFKLFYGDGYHTCNYIIIFVKISFPELAD